MRRRMHEHGAPAVDQGVGEGVAQEGLAGFGVGEQPEESCGFIAPTSSNFNPKDIKATSPIPGVRWTRTRICYLWYLFSVSFFAPGSVVWLLWCGGLGLPVGPLIARVDSIAVFGGRFACPGFAGFVPLAPGAADGLAFQLSEASCLRGLRISMSI